MDDVRIIELYWSRSESAITETSARYEAYCHAIAYNILYSREDSEECVNDTWLRAWNAMPPQRPSCLSAFLGRITRNLSLNRLKERLTRKRGGGRTGAVLGELEKCLPDVQDFEKEIDDRALVDLFNRFLGGLCADDRKIFVRRYWYLSSVREIADDYSFTESKVKMSLSRTRSQLKKRLTEEGIAL